MPWAGLHKIVLALDNMRLMLYNIPEGLEIIGSPKIPAGKG
jgi:hypothetical protein